MGKKLSKEDQDNLVEVLKILYGSQSQFASYKNRFNTTTIAEVELTLNDLAEQ